MAHIGIFNRKNDGYKGTIRTLTLDREIEIIPAVASDAENAPNYRVLTGDVEIGAGWKRTGEKAGEYVSLVLDDPALSQPIRANLFQSGDDKSAWVLNWNRPPKRSERN